jgi:hypothetical protein
MKNEIIINSLGYYESPVTGERWTKEQWDEYVAWEDGRRTESSIHDCDDCCGCEKCED